MRICTSFTLIFAISINRVYATDTENRYSYTLPLLSVNNASVPSSYSYPEYSPSSSSAYHSSYPYYNNGIKKPVISARDSQAYSAPIGSGGGGGYTGSGSYGAPGGGFGQSYEYAAIPVISNQGYDVEMYDEEDDEEGGGFGPTELLCVAKIVGYKIKKYKLLKKIKKLKKIIKIIKLFPILLPIIGPFLLILGLPLLLLPIAIIAGILFFPTLVTYPPPSPTGGKRNKKSHTQGQVEVNSTTTNWTWQTEECIEKLSCQIAQNSEKTLGRGNIQKMVGFLVQKTNLGKITLFEKINSGINGEITDCSQFKCKGEEAKPVEEFAN